MVHSQLRENNGKCNFDCTFHQISLGVNLLKGPFTLTDYGITTSASLSTLQKMDREFGNLRRRWRIRVLLM